MAQARHIHQPVRVVRSITPSPIEHSDFSDKAESEILESTNIPSINEVVDSTLGTNVEHAVEKKKSPRLLLALGGTALAIAIAAGVIFGSAGKANNKDIKVPTATGDVAPSPVPSANAIVIENTPSPSSTENTATASPSETIPAVISGEVNHTSIDYHKLPDNVVEGYAFNQLSAEKQTEIKRYEAMSVADFQKLPLDEQLTFAYWVFENYRGRTDLALETNEINVKYNKNPKTPEDLLQSTTYIDEFILSLNTASGDPSRPLAYDSNTAKKCVSLCYGNLNDENVKLWNNTIDHNAPSGAVVYKFKYTLIDSQKTDNGYDITYNDTGTEITLGFKYHNFIDIEGKAVTMPLCMSRSQKN